MQERDSSRPPGRWLGEAMAPWFDHPAAWLVLLCLGLTFLAFLAALAGDGVLDPVLAFFAIVATGVAVIPVVERSATLESLAAGRRRTRRLAADR